MKWLVFVILTIILGVSIAVYSAGIPGDINGDGSVDFADFLILAQNYGMTGGDSFDPDTDFSVATRPPFGPWNDIAADLRKSVYWLGVTTANSTDPIVFIGTGFAVEDELLATNAHVLRAAFVLVSEVGKLGLQPAFVAIGADGSPNRFDMYDLAVVDGITVGFLHPEWDGTAFSPDLALVIIDPDTESKTFPSHVTLIGSKEAKALNVGDEIATLGFPGEFETSHDRKTIRAIPTWKVGNVSALRPYKSETSSQTPMGRISNRVVQHDFNVSRGTSGSPIVNRRGEVVAVNNAVSREEASLGFAIRADVLRGMMQAIDIEFDGDLSNAAKLAIEIE